MVYLINGLIRRAIGTCHFRSVAALRDPLLSRYCLSEKRPSCHPMTGIWNKNGRQIVDREIPVAVRERNGQPCFLPSPLRCRRPAGADARACGYRLEGEKQGEPQFDSGSLATAHRLLHGGPVLPIR